MRTELYTTCVDLAMLSKINYERLYTAWIHYTGLKKQAETMVLQVRIIIALGANSYQTEAWGDSRVLAMFYSWSGKLSEWVYF